MELKRKSEENSLPLLLANRKSLFQLLSFLDDKLPEHCAIHSFVSVTLLTDSSSLYRVYFRRSQASIAAGAMTDDADDFSVIFGMRIEHVMNSNQQIQKSWNLTAWAKDDETLAKAFMAIDVINWKEDRVVMHYKNDKPPPTITNFIISKHGQSEEDGKLCFQIDQYLLPIKVALNLKLSSMDGVYVKSLDTCHAQTVYDYWPYKHSTTVKDVVDEIEQLPSAGVFLKENDELVSWIMSHPPTGMSRLYTMEQHRRRGYAALATQYLSKRVAQTGCVPFVNINSDNDASYKFFAFLGFQRDRSGHIFVSLPAN